MRRRALISALPALALGAPRPAAAAAEKVLRVTLPSAESMLDPPQTNTNLYSTTILAQIFESPLAYDYLARPVRLQPLTASALPEVSADFTTLTLRIRPGIFFADDPAFKGQPRELVAADYAYAIKRFYDPRYNSSDLYLFQNAKLPGLVELREQALRSKQAFDYDTPVDGIRALDRYTLRIRLGQPDPRFVYLLADPAIFGAVAREVVEFYGDEISAHPVGTGPYRLVAWRRASRIELARSPSFRHLVYTGQPADEPLAREIATGLAGRRLPLADRVVVDVIDEDQPRWLAFLNGEHDHLQLPGLFAPMAAPNGRIAPFLAKRGVRLQRALRADIDMSFFNMRHPLVGGYTPDKVALRRAIALAHDGAEYIRLVRGGGGQAAQSVVPPFTTGYDAAYRSEMGRHSPAEARALLDLYGYVDRDGDGWRETPDGRPLLLRMAAINDQRRRLQNELWKRALDRVGLRIEFDIATWPELLNRSRAGSLMMWGFGWSASSPDGGFFLALAYGPNADESNDARFALPAYDRLFERQRGLPDGPEREALMRQAKDLLVAYMPYKVHAHRIEIDLVQPWTRHYWRHPFLREPWQYMDVGGRDP